MAKFADVILPLPLPTNYTYSIPPQWEGSVQAGCRVSVPLGTKKHYTAIVVATHDNEPTDCKVRPIEELLDEAPIILPTQLKLWEWIARYYLCSMGDIYKAAIPQGLKGEFKPRTEIRTRLTKHCCDEKAVALVLQSLSRAPRQKRLLNTYLQMSQFHSGQCTEVAKHKLLEQAQVQPNIYKELTDKGFLESYEVEIGRLSTSTEPVVPQNSLNDAQKRAFEDIKEN